MYEKLHFVSRNWRRENRTVACGSSPIKIHYCDYQKRFIKRINNVYDFSFFNMFQVLVWHTRTEQESLSKEALTLKQHGLSSSLFKDV